MASGKNYQIAFSLNSKLSSNFNKTFASATKQMQGLARTAKTVAGVALGAIGIKNTLGTALTEAMNLEGFKMQLETATKSAKKAGEIMKWSIDLANRTPFETGEVVEASARLEAMGLSAQKYVPMIGDMAGATNKDLIQATEAIIDAQAGELERLKEFGIKKSDIIQYAYDKMGQIQVVNNKGQITDQEKFNEAMLALMDEKFKGGMEKQAGTMKGLMSTISGVMKSGMASMVGIASDGTIKQGSLLEVLKGKVKIVADTLVRWQQSGTFEKIGSIATQNIGRMINALKKAKNWTTEVFSNIKLKVSENQPLLDKLRKVINSIKNTFREMGNNTILFDSINWIKDIGIPGIIDGMVYILEKAFNISEIVKENWGIIEPVVVGVTSALGTYKLALVASAAATKGHILVTKGMALAQGALNTVMNLSPLAKWSIIIGAVIAVGLLVIKNWDKIKETAINVWNSIKSTFGNIGQWFSQKWNEALQVTQIVWNNIASFLGSFPLGQAFLQNITNMIESVKTIFNGVTTFITGVFTGNWKMAWEGVKNIFSGIVSGFGAILKAPINAIIGMVNTLIGGLNKISIDIPTWAPIAAGKSFGIKIPAIPMFAKGTKSTPRGSFIAGERGPELISGAPGRRVFTNAETNGILKGDGIKDIKLVYNPVIQVSGEDANLESKIQRILASEKLKMFAEFTKLIKSRGRLAYD